MLLKSEAPIAAAGRASGRFTWSRPSSASASEPSRRSQWSAGCCCADRRAAGLPPSPSRAEVSRVIRFDLVGLIGDHGRILGQELDRAERLSPGALPRKRVQRPLAALVDQELLEFRRVE